MDINSLLSPQDSPVSEEAARSPTKAAGPPGHHPLASQQPHPPPTSMPPHARAVKLGTTSSMPSPPLSDFPHRPQRQTSGMDTLADLASMQHHQQLARANAGGLKNPEPYEAQLSSANIRPSLQSIARTHSGSKSSLDIRMADGAPTKTPLPRVFAAASLSADQLRQVSQLVDFLAANSHAYESHVQLIRLLHRGFVAHVFPSDSGVQENGPESYALLGDLKQAIEAMGSRFSLGEELWEVRLQVAQLTAANLDDCTALMEAFEKAVAEELSSTRLWSLYGEWYLSMYSAGKPSDTAAAELSQPLSLLPKLSEEDRLVVAEVFTRDQMLEVWVRAADDTKFRIDDGHLVWDRLLELRLADLKAAPTSEAIALVKVLFLERLGMPHKTWEDTFQHFSSFISTYENAEYEETMVAVNKHGAKAKFQYAEREQFEISIRNATAAEDTAATWHCLEKYIAWELSKNRKRNHFSFDLTNALYLRSLLRFPAVVDAWEDYLTFLADEGARGTETASQLSVLGRACDHCSWSGNLWSQYILAAELEGLPFADIGQIKHKATSTGLLDFGGIEEVLKIHNAWCSCLKRQAFQQNSTDDDLDVAEVGIRSAIEDVETLGKSKYGADYAGDPQYRLERIYIQFLTQNRNYKGARDTWKQLAKRHGNSYEFWLRYYSWEMWVWASSLNQEGQSSSHQAPSEATIVLREAVDRETLDWPEKIIETYMSHCEDHENAAEIQTAILLCRKTVKVVQERRSQEALEAAELAQQQAPAAEAQGTETSKRKRDRGQDESSGNKKQKTTEGAPIQDSEGSAPKRDRENATVIVSNLPADVTEKHLRHFFNDCGTINTIHLSKDENSSTATLEFETKDDALTAQTRDQKLYGDNIIEVAISSGTTLYVTNFPPTADESYIKDLFVKHGTIIDVRFPSLKYDTHRRFCYVQFQTPGQARAATQLDGHDLGDNLKLLAKISDPAHKQSRQGPAQEGREVFASNVNWSATEEQLGELFSKHGTIERVRIPRKVGGQSKGFAFVVFSNKDEATAALALDQAEFQSRQLRVEISANPAKRQAATTVNRSATPEGAQRSDQAYGDSTGPGRESIAAKTVVLLKVPDTVNVARIKELMEPYGDLVKVTLRPDHQGAVVEYKDVHAAGKAALGVEGHEIAPGRKLQVGTFDELKYQKSEVRSEGPQLAQPAAPIRRPAQRGGRRGGLGVKRGPAPAGSGSREPGGTNTNGSAKAAGPADGSAKGVKSNADFKALFAKKEA